MALLLQDSKIKWCSQLAITVQVLSLASAAANLILKLVLLAKEHHFQVWLHFFVQGLKQKKSIFKWCWGGWGFILSLRIVCCNAIESTDTETQTLNCNPFDTYDFFD